MNAPEKTASVTFIAIRSGPKHKACPSGEAILVWLLFLCEGANLHAPKGQRNEF
jgi:hypothetical protein